MQLPSRFHNLLPGASIGLGGLFLFVGQVSKEYLSASWGQLPLLQLPCAFFSAVFIPFGSLLALRALVGGYGERRMMTGFHFGGNVFLVVMLTMYYFADWSMHNMIQPLAELPSLLPKLTSNALTIPNGEKRLDQARYAFIVYGTTVAYRLDNQQLAVFQPTPDDQHRRQEVAKVVVLTKQAMRILNGVAAQFPYLFGLYAATYAAAFSAGWLWFLARPPDRPTSA